MIYEYLHGFVVLKLFLDCRQVLSSDASFQAVFPLRQSSDLTSLASRRLLLDRTEGVTVRIVRLLETLAIDAIRSGKERIDRDSLENLRVPPPLLSMAKAIEKALP